MDRQVFENQRIVFAVGGQGYHACVLLAEGEGVKDRTEEHPFDLLGDIHDKIPKEPGIYEWVGTYWVHPQGWAGSEPIDQDEGFQGEFKKLDVPLSWPKQHKFSIHANDALLIALYEAGKRCTKCKGMRQVEAALKHHADAQALAADCLAIGCDPHAVKCAKQGDDSFMYAELPF